MQANKGEYVDWAIAKREAIRQLLFWLNVISNPALQGARSRSAIATQSGHIGKDLD